MGELAGQPNYFVEKIWNGLIDHNGLSSDDFEAVVDDFTKYLTPFRDDIDKQGYMRFALRRQPKIHTIRLDPHDRWKPGMKIHPVINNRTKNRFQFAPVLECVSTQKIVIQYKFNDGSYFLDNHAFPIFGNAGKYERNALILIDDNRLNFNMMNSLAINDGFPNAYAFFQYFNQDFTGKIIHWTDLKY